MKRNRLFLAAAIVTLLAAGAHAVCPMGPDAAVGPSGTAFKSDEAVLQDLSAQHKPDEGVPQNLIAQLASDEGVPLSLVTAVKTQDLVAAARSAERNFEHREPPPKHLVAGSCEELERERSVAG